MGAYFKSRLLELQERHALIGDVRGLGLLLGIELVRDRVTQAPATAETRQLVELARQRGLLVGKAGGFWNVIRFAPPMCVTRPDIDFVADCLDECLRAMQRDTPTQAP